MIDRVDRQLVDWAARVLGDVEISLAPPGRTQGKPTLGLYLTELLPCPPASGATRMPLQIALRYLITVQWSHREEAHRLLGKVVLAAMQEPDFAVELEPLSAAGWSALGVPPLPSFFIRVPLRESRSVQSVPRVTHPATVRYAPGIRLRGIVVGPGECPIPGARVEVPALGLTTRTNCDGCFEFPRFPGKPDSQTLRVVAKGQEFSLPLERPNNERKRIVVNLSGMEI